MTTAQFGTFMSALVGLDVALVAVIVRTTIRGTEQMHRRFDQMHHRFDDLDARFDSLETPFDIRR